MSKAGRGIVCDIGAPGRGSLCISFHVLEKGIRLSRALITYIRVCASNQITRARFPVSTTLCPLYLFLLHSGVSTEHLHHVDSL